MMASVPISFATGEKNSLVYAPYQKVDVQIFPAFAHGLSRAWLRKVAEKALSTQCGGEPMNISLVIADDETVHDLNRKYRGLDETTDVLAFPLWESHEDGDPSAEKFLLPAEAIIPSGEIVISYPQAVRQAKYARKLIRSEISLLIVHGVLHLLGYDHTDHEGESNMWAKQDEILAKVSLS